MSQEDVFVCRVFLTGTRTLDDLAEFLSAMNGKGGRASAARASYYPATKMLQVVLERDPKLAAAPSGTHEWARGWLHHEAAVETARFAGHSVLFVPMVDYDRGRRLYPDHSVLRRSFSVDP